MNITIKTIPHDEQRYETPGDWWFDPDGTLQIRVSDIGNWKYEALVAVHEMHEVLLCKSRGITVAQVDAFDIQFEKDRADGNHSPEEEPGSDPSCPCHQEHIFATALEELFAQQLGVPWKEYDKTVVSLQKTNQK